ncbi:probable protein S-acyltransferase 19 isoform X2 [Physcomitrium patens]|uniref:probable protein S-acyltransferase 19 isoform X2 n=1 Tax=Physcomitrium patens TaxID=3218 RepID=UPI003CCD522A
MVRCHGWLLPVHLFQVPFSWSGGLESAAFALYSPLFITGLLLCVRCSAINRADPGVLKNWLLSEYELNSHFPHISGGMTSSTSSLLQTNA